MNKKKRKSKSNITIKVTQSSDSEFQWLVVVAVIVIGHCFQKRFHFELNSSQDFFLWYFAEQKKYLVHRVHSFICCSKYVHHLRLYSNRHLFVVTLLSKERKKEKQKLFHYKFKGRAKQWPLWKFAYINLAHCYNNDNNKAHLKKKQNKTNVIIQLLTKTLTDILTKYEQQQQQQ